MTDIPIIFSAPMVRALLEGRKTMTRRLAWQFKTLPAQKPDGSLHTSKMWQCFSSNGDGIETWRRHSPWQKVKVGDRLWVRESACFTIDQGTRKPAKTEWFLADGENPYRDNFTVKSRPSIHMPRWASRITLVVTETKIQLLQGISEMDACAEGCEEDWADGLPVWYVPGGGMSRHRATGEECFEWLWSSLHGVESWEANPDVVALTFTVHQQNIDAMDAPA